MHILIAFETIEGQTRKISEFVADRLRAKGHSIQMFDTQDKRAAFPIIGVDKVILAALVHERRHPQSFEVFVSADRAKLNSLQTLLISVSLNAAFPETIDEAKEYVTEMKMRTGFMPNTEVLVAGAVRPGSYGYFETQVVRNVLLADRKIDVIKGDHEFTDWRALGLQIDTFLDLAPNV